MFIYKITNIVNNKIYIGKTTKPLEERLYEHWRSAKWKKNKTAIGAAILKYGRENFIIEQLDSGNDIEDLNTKEKWWILHIQPHYNLHEGGTGGDTSMSPNYKRAIQNRDTKGPKNPMFGRRGINNPNFGRKNTPEQNERVRNGVLNSWINNPERREKARHIMIQRNKARKAVANEN